MLFGSSRGRMVWIMGRDRILFTSAVVMVLLTARVFWLRFRESDNSHLALHVV